MPKKPRARATSPRSLAALAALPALARAAQADIRRLLANPTPETLARTCRATAALYLAAHTPAAAKEAAHL